MIGNNVNKMSEAEFASYIEQKFSIPVLSEHRGDESFQPEDSAGVYLDWSASDDDGNDLYVNDCAILRFTSCMSGVRYKVLILSAKSSGSKYKISALHEVGHSFEVDEKEVISKEVDAWNFAELEAKKIDLTYNRHDVKMMIGTYIMKHNQSARRKKSNLVVRKCAK